MAWFGKNKNGKDVCLLNPREKGQKYFIERQNKIRYTNTGVPKVDEKGDYITIEDVGLAFRAGYLEAQKDANRAYRAKHPNYKNKKNVSTFVLKV